MESKEYATTCDETEAHLNIPKDFSTNGGGQGCTNADGSEERSDFLEDASPMTIQSYHNAP